MCFFYWSMLSIDIHSPEDADELLKAVIKLWVTIRGYSLTAAWFEEYKKSTSFQQQEKGSAERSSAATSRLVFCILTIYV